MRLFIVYRSKGRDLVLVLLVNSGNKTEIAGKHFHLFFTKTQSQEHEREDRSQESLHQSVDDLFSLAHGKALLVPFEAPLLTKETTIGSSIEKIHVGMRRHSYDV